MKFCLFYFNRLESSICSGGELIVGNIVNKVRRKRRNKPNPTPSEYSSASVSSLLESSSQNILNSNKFPLLLPQSSVTLELGVINTEPVLSSEQIKCEQDQDVHQLIEMCQRWRELSRKSRETHYNKTNFYDKQHDTNENQ